MGAGAAEGRDGQDEGGKKRGVDGTLMEDCADVKVVTGGGRGAGKRGHGRQDPQRRLESVLEWCHALWCLHLSCRGMTTVRKVLPVHGVVGAPLAPDPAVVCPWALERGPLVPIPTSHPSNPSSHPFTHPFTHPHTHTQMQKRNRRLFGSLLGTLAKFKREEEDDGAREVAARRAAMLHRAEQKAEGGFQASQRAAREGLLAERARGVQARADIALQADLRRLELRMARRLARIRGWDEQYLLTQAEPALYWRPAEGSAAPVEVWDRHREARTRWMVRPREGIGRGQGTL